MPGRVDVWFDEEFVVIYSSVASFPFLGERALLVWLRQFLGHGVGPIREVGGVVMKVGRLLRLAGLRV